MNEKRQEIEDYLRHNLRRAHSSPDGETLTPLAMKLADKMPGCHLPLSECRACKNQLSELVDTINQIVEVAHK